MHAWQVKYTARKEGDKWTRNCCKIVVAVSLESAALKAIECDENVRLIQVVHLGEALIPEWARGHGAS